MKKFFCLLTVWILIFSLTVNAEDQSYDVDSEETDLVPGDIIVFGHYEQDGYMNGPEPIEWVILDMTDTSLMLMSVTPLDYQPYNNKKEDVRWSTSTLKKFLSDDFINNAFYPNEAAVIEDTDYGKVFLLSSSEYAIYSGIIPSIENELPEQVKNMQTEQWLSDNETWWLRDSGDNKKEAICVEGEKTKNASVTDMRCIRPVIWITDTEYDWDNDVFTLYSTAYEYAENEKYEEAIAIFDSLGDYYGSYIDSADCRVRAGDAYRENKQYAEAITWYEDAREYILEMFDPDVIPKLYAEDGPVYDLPDKILESKYLLATTLMESGDTTSALEVLLSLGQYKDSTELMKQCFDAENLQYSWITGPSQYPAVNAGKDTGYSKTNPIEKKDDPHAGWQLGRFRMVGYTERQDGESPVFFKTPGDNLILQFVLEQDIDALNGNVNCVIADDTNGRDPEFGYSEESDFGRGTLFVRHIDPSYDEHVQIYQTVDKGLSAVTFLRRRGKTKRKNEDNVEYIQ